MQKISNVFLFLGMIVVVIMDGFFTLLNLKAHDRYVEKIIEHKNFKEYIVVDEDIDELKYGNYLIYVDKGTEQEFSPIEKSGVEKGELAWAYSIKVKVNEKFVELSREEQFELIQDLSHYLKDKIIGVGPLHKGFYHQLSLYYNNPEKGDVSLALEPEKRIYDSTKEQPYMWLDKEIHEPNQLNGLSKEEWIYQK